MLKQQLKARLTVRANRHWWSSASEKKRTNASNSWKHGGDSRKKKGHDSYDPSVIMSIVHTNFEYSSTAEGLTV